jgi:hypothetical protein
MNRVDLRNLDGVVACNRHPNLEPFRLTLRSIGPCCERGMATGVWTQGTLPTTTSTFASLMEAEMKVFVVLGLVGMFVTLVGVCRPDFHDFLFGIFVTALLLSVGLAAGLRAERVRRVAKVEVVG